MRQLKIQQQITVRDTRSVNSYLSEVSRVSNTINAEEEVELARRIKEGDEEAADKLVLANLRFVISVAKQYQTSGAMLEDLISEGNAGLIKAAWKFDHTKGFKFISYAVWWIRQTIMQYLAESSRTVRLPLNRIGQLNKARNIRSMLEQNLDREPTSDEIQYERARIELLNEKGFEPSVDDVLDFVEKETNINSIETIVRAGTKPSSIDIFMGDDSTTRMSDLMISPEGNKATSKLEHDDLKYKLEIAMSNMKSREQYVLTHFYGLFGESQKTLEEIGGMLELTRERVRQIREKALRQMRRPISKASLREFL